MNQVIPFIFDEYPVRTVVVEESPWWVAKDVCKILGLENVTKALYGLDEDEKFALTNSEGKNLGFVHATAGINVINESGLYSLIFQSRKPEAKSFKKWVTSEVLPQIRKTGAYGAVTLDTQTLNTINDTLAAAKNRIFDLEKDQAHLRQRERLYRKVERLEALLAKKNTALSDDEKAQIRGLRNNASVPQIARLLNRSPSSVRKVLKAAAV